MSLKRGRRENKKRKYIVFIFIVIVVGVFSRTKETKMGGRKLGKTVNWLLDFYNTAKRSESPCRDINPRARPSVYLYDMMEKIVGKPKNIKTTHALKCYYANTIQWIFKSPGSTINTVIVLVDKKTVVKENNEKEDDETVNITGPIGKLVHERVWRDRNYKKKTTDKENLNNSSSESSTDDDDEDYNDEDYHVINDDNNRPLPPNWGRYTKMRDRVRREVFPLLLSVLCDDRYITLQPNQVIGTSGLPFCVRPETVTMDGKIIHNIYAPQISITPEMEQLDPDIYNKGALIRRHKEPYKEEVTLCLYWPDWDNDIWEADLQVPFFMHKLEHQNILIRANDRDFVPIVLANSFDRLENGRFVNHVYLELPSKSKKGGKVTNRKTYVAMNELYKLIDNDTIFAPQIYNRVMTMVFLIIMVGCDHTRKGFLKELNPIKDVIRTFYANSLSYTHMVQFSRMLVRDSSAIRVPVVDERAVLDFVNRCYLEKHGSAVATKQRKEYEKKVRAVERKKKKRKREKENERKQLEKLKRKYKLNDSSLIASFEETEDEDEKFFQSIMPKRPKFIPSRHDLKKYVVRKDADRLIPERTTIRGDCRNCVHTIVYYLNGGRDQSLFMPGGRFDYLKVSPEDNESYYGYKIDEKTKTIVQADYVSTIQDLSEVPSCYIRHLKKKNVKPSKENSFDYSKEFEKLVHREEHDRKENFLDSMDEKYK